MPYPRPPLTDLRQQIATDIDGATDGVNAFLRHSNMGIIGQAVAGTAHGHYGYLDYIAKQSVPFTATDEYLEGWAALKGVTRKPATYASGVAAFPGTNGKVVPAGTIVSRGDGVQYSSTADATVASGSAAVPIVALATGPAGNAASGTVLYLGAGISGVTSTGAASGVITGGAAIERDDALQARMLTAYRKPGEGGSIDDYGIWATQVPGVTRAWVVRNVMGPGSIGLLFMMDDAQAAFGGFPQGTNGCSTYEARGTAATGDQLTLANYIFSLQPATPLVICRAPLPNTIDLTLTGISGTSSAVKDAIATAVIYALRAGGRPGGVTQILAIEAAIAAVAGSEGAVLTSVTASAGTVAPGSTGNITSNAGCLPVLGTISYA